MNPNTLASMCHDMIDNLRDCLETLESPVEHERDLLKSEWISNIQEAYKFLG